MEALKEEEMNKVDIATEIFLEEYSRINRKFAKEILKEWEGRGNFSEFARQRLIYKWLQLGISN